MILRVRSEAGTWRITVGSASSTVSDVKGVIFAEKQVPVDRQRLSSDPQGAKVLVLRLCLILVQSSRLFLPSFLRLHRIQRLGSAR